MNRYSRMFAAICREPYRLFFPLGILTATIGISQWSILNLGGSPSHTGYFHSSVQTMVYMNCFIIGFLMTSLPRFTQTAVACWWEVITPVVLFIGIIIFLSLDEWVLAEGALLGCYIFLICFVLSRVIGRSPSASRAAPPVELIWVPIALLQGIVGVLILILGQLQVWPAWAIKVGKPMMDQGFLICLVMGVGGFLIPRLMGTYEQTPNKSLIFSKARDYLIGGGIFFISFFIEGFGFEALAYGLRAIVITISFLRSDVLGKIPKEKEWHIWMIWGAVWMLAAGYWGASLFISHRIEMLHVAFIGGLSLMIFAIASMVIMTHAGEASKLKEGVWVFPVVIGGVLLALLNRLLMGMFPSLYFQALKWAANIWILVAWAWLFYMLPRVFRVPEEDEFGKMHEQIKAKRALG